MDYTENSSSNGKTIIQKTKYLNHQIKIMRNNYERTELQKWFFRTDLISLLNEEYTYYKMVINQVHSNYILFKQGTTKNIMDYHNKRVLFLSNQINIMRSDMQNYIDIATPKPATKK